MAGGKGTLEVFDAALRLAEETRRLARELNVGELEEYAGNLERLAMALKEGGLRVFEDGVFQCRYKGSVLECYRNLGFTTLYFTIPLGGDVGERLAEEEARLISELPLIMRSLGDVAATLIHGGYRALYVGLEQG